MTVGTRLLAKLRHLFLSPWFWLFALAVVLFWLAATFNLLLPGINYDEVADVVPAMEFLLKQPLDVAGSLHIAGREWPLMIMPYVGSTTTFLALPAFYLQGVTVAVLRHTTILIGLLSLCLAWGFLREYFDERVAALATLLLAVSPTYIFWSRMGTFVALPLLPITILTLWLLFRWYQRRSNTALVLAAFCLGFGLTTKLLFIWVWIALALSWLVLSPWLEPKDGLRRWLWPWRRINPKVLLLCIVAVGIGVIPVVLYNVQGWNSFNFFKYDVLAGEGGHFSLLASLRAVPVVAVRDLATLLEGSWFISRLGEPFSNPLGLPALVVAVITLVGLAVGRRPGYSNKRLAFLLIYLTSLTVMSSAVGISQGAHHLLILFPVPQALIAAAVFSLADVVRAAQPSRRRVALTAIGLVVICLVGAEAWTTFRYHRELEQTGGVGHFSDAIYQLAEDAEKPDFSRLVVLDWGFTRNLQFLSQGRLRPETRFTYESPPTPEFTAYLEDHVARPGALYLFHTPRFTVFPGHWEVFERVAHWHGLVPVLYNTYFQRDGEPVYLLYRLDPAPPLYKLPSTAEPLQAYLGEDLALAGYTLSASEVRPGSGLDLMLYWRAVQSTQSSYKVFAHLVDESGKLWAQHDGIPRHWEYPTDAWQPGEIVPDHIELSISPETPPGNYHLFVGMYDQATQQRLPLQMNGQRMQGDTLELATVRVGG